MCFVGSAFLPKRCQVPTWTLIIHLDILFYSEMAPLKSPQALKNKQCWCSVCFLRESFSPVALLFCHFSFFSPLFLVAMAPHLYSHYKLTASLKHIICSLNCICSSSSYRQSKITWYTEKIIAVISPICSSAFATFFFHKVLFFSVCFFVVLCFLFKFLSE